MPGNTKINLVGCAMYAFTHRLKAAWMEILENLHHHLSMPYSGKLDIRFDGKTEILADPGLFMSHTCGYPYITRWHHTHDVVCVPEFTVPGCNRGKYSSWIIAPWNSGKSELADFTGSTAVINNLNSNSGMNVFRYEVSKYATSDQFFRDVLVSDSHLESMHLVAQGKADLAAIDAVTFALAVQQNLVDKNNFKIITQTGYTTGLPFVVPKKLDIDPRTIINALNTSMYGMSPENKAVLNISSFIPVSTEDYFPIRELEHKAQLNGYPVLR